MELLLADDVLTKTYHYMDQFDRSAFLHHLSHSKPSLRILEIGAGTGGATENTLKDLVLPNGQVMYSNYCFTDISSGFFSAARERFKTAVNMEFATLDIKQGPGRTRVWRPPVRPRHCGKRAPCDSQFG